MGHVTDAGLGPGVNAIPSKLNDPESCNPWFDNLHKYEGSTFDVLAYFWTRKKSTGLIRGVRPARDTWSNSSTRVPPTRQVITVLVNELGAPKTIYIYTHHLGLCELSILRCRFGAFYPLRQRSRKKSRFYEMTELRLANEGSNLAIQPVLNMI